MAKTFYSLRQYTPTELEGGPDNSRRQTKVKKDESYLHWPQKGCLWVRDVCQCQHQAQVHAKQQSVLLPGSLAKDSGYGQHGILERKCIGSLVDSGTRSIRVTGSGLKKFYESSLRHSDQTSTPLLLRLAPRDGH